jgi:hypothetical protein
MKYQSDDILKYRKNFDAFMDEKVESSEKKDSMTSRGEVESSAQEKLQLLVKRFSAIQATSNLGDTNHGDNAYMKQIVSSFATGISVEE